MPAVPMFLCYTTIFFSASRAVVLQTELTFDVLDYERRGGGQ